MLTSMTGHGQSHKTAEGLQVWAEVRAVNNRYLKVSFSSADRMTELEAEAKALVQKYARRGSVHISLEIQRVRKTPNYRLNTELLEILLEQLKSIDDTAKVDSLLGLTGIVEDASPKGPQETSSEENEVLLSAIEEALQRLVEMRKVEGASAAQDLLTNCGQIQKHLHEIEARAPEVARDYSRRLTERINHMLGEHEVSIQPADVVREVGIFADKCDISEETVRLQTHIDQFAEIINSGQGDGRKLEFFSQEMLRETNTIGSKANDSQIAQHVVEIKTAIDRIREMTQNVE